MCAGFAASAYGQGAPPWTIREADNNPRVLSPTLITVSNGTLTCTGKSCTLTTGGGGSPGGSGSNLQYRAGASTFGGVTSSSVSGANITLGGILTVSLAGNNLSLTNSTDGASVQVALLQGDRATPAGNDEAYSSLQLSDDGGGQTEVARMTWAIPTATAGAEDGRIDWSVMTGGSLAKELQLSGADLAPSSSDGLALGTTSLMWSDLFLASGGVINWNAGDVTITHSANTLTFAGASTGYVFDSTVAATNITASGTIVQTSASATAFESGPNGGTNPVFRLVNNVASAATGLSVTGNAAGSGVTLTAISSGTNEGIFMLTKGTGRVTMTPGSSTDVLLLRNASSQNALLLGDPGTGGGSEIQILTPGGGARVYMTSEKGVQLASGMKLAWIPNTTFVGGTSDTDIQRAAASVLRIGQADVSSTAAGNLIIGTSAGAIGTSGAGVLAFTLSTAPSTSPADTVQLYSNDSAATDHNLFSRNEAGEINRLTGLSARNSSAFAKTTDTTLANITGLTRNVEASRAYAFRAVLETTAAATGGVKFAVSGTATATSINYEGILYNGAAVVAQTRSTALDGVVCAVTNATAATCVIEGVIVVNAAGTLTIQFAQNASDGGASTVLINQYLQLIPIS